MPYEIRNKGGMFQVVNADSGKVMGTFSNVDKAKKQMKALYVSEPETSDTPQHEHDESSTERKKEGD